MRTPTQVSPTNTYEPFSTFQELLLNIIPAIELCPLTLKVAFPLAKQRFEMTVQFVSQQT